MFGEDLLVYILPEIMVLIPVLIIIGSMLKKAPYIKDWTIPIILAFVGILLSVLIIGFANGFSPQNVANGVIQGILATGMAVYVHQLSIQTGRKRDQD